MHQKNRILIITDAAENRAALADKLREQGHAVDVVPAAEALTKLDAVDADIVVAPLRVPDLDGVELMRRARVGDAQRSVILLAAPDRPAADINAALRAGAADVLTQPVDPERLAISLERALERRRIADEAAQLRGRTAEAHRLSSMTGSTPAMQQLFEAVREVAPSRAAVLITGEPGSGKARIAAAIHEHSPRAGAPFIKLSCAGLTEQALESELFGAGPGASARPGGRFQQAGGGTLFLQEIGDLPLPIQKKLLRFLTDGEVQRAGAKDSSKPDVRLIASSSRDLAAKAKDGSFDEELLQRLRGVSIEVPALRTRQPDVALLAMSFLKRFAGEHGKSVQGFDDEALDRLSRYAWPNNVRELEHAIERAVVVARGDTVRARDLPASVTPAAGTPGGAPVVPGATLADLEKHAILRTLEHTHGSTSRAAEILGISTRKIQYKLHEYRDDQAAERRSSNPPENGIEAGGGG